MKKSRNQQQASKKNASKEIDWATAGGIPIPKLIPDQARLEPRASVPSTSDLRKNLSSQKAESENTGVIEIQSSASLSTLGGLKGPRKTRKDRKAKRNVDPNQPSMVPSSTGDKRE